MIIEKWLEVLIIVVMIFVIDSLCVFIVSCCWYDKVIDWIECRIGCCVVLCD